MAQRLKGQEVQVRILQDGAPLSNLTTVRSMTVEPQFEILSEGYLGETTDRKDSVKKGCQVKIAFHHDDPQVLTLIQAINDKATRRTPGLRIDILAVLKFPNGKTARVSIPDCESGSVPLVTSGKNAYVQSDFTFEASDFRILQVA